MTKIACRVCLGACGWREGPEFDGKKELLAIIQRETLSKQQKQRMTNRVVTHQTQKPRLTEAAKRYVYVEAFGIAPDGSRYRLLCSQHFSEFTGRSQGFAAHLLKYGWKSHHPSNNNTQHRIPSSVIDARIDALVATELNPPIQPLLQSGNPPIPTSISPMISTNTPLEIAGEEEHAQQ